MLNKIDEKFQNAQSSNLSLIKTEMNLFDKKLEISYQEKASELSKKYASTVASNLYAIQTLTVQIKELELENTISDGCKENVLTEYFRLAEEIQKLGISYDWKLSRCLIDAKELLEDGIKLDPMEYPEITSFLNSLPNQFNDVVGTIRKFLA
ncbi:hypothetical protein [Shewanella sp. UCD-KL21]|uniref:hypothetical protein n=1 Tax=Shewanella sp. UCD-KL21 TaxID=1917164 RepID=UPI00111580D3|nr:hypothetical protein [Shewanella sp. UCD-KL21]